MARHDWLLVDEVAETLQADAEAVNALADAGAFAYLQLPDGSKRIDRRSFRRYLRACQLGYSPKDSLPLPVPAPRPRATRHRTQAAPSTVEGSLT